jgi:hypothetical protein
MLKSCCCLFDRPTSRVICFHYVCQEARLGEEVMFCTYSPRNADRLMTQSACPSTIPRNEKQYKVPLIANKHMEAPRKQPATPQPQPQSIELLDRNIKPTLHLHEHDPHGCMS